MSTPTPQEEPRKGASPDSIPEAVVERGPRLSLLWVIPVIAAAAAGWLVYKSHSQRGPEIQITFPQVTGLEAGKTSIKVRGVDVGVVESLSISPDFSRVTVHARLNKSAEGLAVEGSKFWVVKPEISLGRISGLDTIVSGVYIAARNGKGSFQDKFEALAQRPPTEYEDPGLSLKLIGEDGQAVNEGAPIYYKRLPVGVVEGRTMAPDGTNVLLQVYIKPEYANLVGSKTVFWKNSGMNFSAGPGLINVHTDSLQTIIQGGLFLDTPEGGTPGTAARDGDRFELFKSREEADYSVLSLVLRVKNAQGINAGRTYIRNQGVIVGIVRSVKMEPGAESVRLDVGLCEAAEGLACEGARYRIVRPKVDWAGAQGLDTVFGGVFIDAVAGEAGEPRKEFDVRDWSVTDKILDDHPGGMFITLKGSALKVTDGSPIYYRRVAVGQVVGTGLSSDGKHALVRALIYAKYTPLLRQNSVFWNASGMKASLGLFAVKVQAESLQGIVLGSIAFATPEGNRMGARVGEDHVFQVRDDFDEDWERWAPEIPLKDNRAF
ncbi:MAG: MlaD family protein [Verrucomicrobiae bacterium]|nr:MlaD family protein [Verrucomicrobiae bacterium]